MKIQGKMFIWLSVFILAVAVVYGYWSKEPAGTTALFLAFGLAIMIGFYLAFTARRVDAGAQDDMEADVADEAGEVGFFSPHSWQPLSLAVGGALAFLGIAVGWWVMYFSAPILMVGLFGWVFEYYRGENRTQ
ncbi:cytochrome c oxidase subunit 4 [Streptomyces violaceoruber]|uniref:Probable cytochrome c oxidase polypeptide 4 n=7 Tax=Streptomyces TaxID=1883 RepID=COX4_STRCO|nr:MULTISPECIES: cytochrome c oxidase subunit 4 [Streptomyces]Q9X812.1 RecName: Full=Probable cytochrome c oxidase polypeptide 4; AltName: Full=Cytochrome aa3 subunit 4; AltName: Full=Cytochrome c oxidase polypeptide IV [Streptomyces coelicolor A3(2)]MYU41680.1 cytochrome c oxidase subunit 4 [Streptomyces sp. SID7813]QSJ11881.1 putative cytochrome c oxidase polypeptide 4 [Streptomyces lividans]AIJ16298.1 putative cytochrome c oxidase polypeptide 4 [Streptomyces lividans TK24]AXL88217.1 cytochr